MSVVKGIEILCCVAVVEMKTVWCSEYTFRDYIKVMLPPDGVLLKQFCQLFIFESDTFVE